MLCPTCRQSKPDEARFCLQCGAQIVTAAVWAPYEFQIDGQTAHCGIDVFSFARIDGVWKVSNSMWTVEPNACAELRPGNPGMVRPRG